MAIEMPRGLPFSVDTFTPSSKKKRHHFLTHAHKDHSVGISAHFSFPIYSTHLTKTLILHHYPQLQHNLFVSIETGQSILIEDPDGNFTVSAFDANHCPGAVMFLFEGHFGNILHTGDCRLTLECLQCLPDKYISRKGGKPQCRLDYIFLDCTFGKFSRRFPSKQSAIQQVINCIWKNPDTRVVYLTCDLLGQEDILLEVSRTFGSKIFVDKATNSECFKSLMITAPEILSQDPSLRFHMFEGFPKLYERASAKMAEARYKFQPEPLIIRPSAQWYACDDECSATGSKKKMRLNEASRDEFGIWHVCYSIHSSKEELEWALQLLAPKCVVSTTPNCRAMELDYVRNHCFRTQISYDDPLWKIVDISVDSSQETGAVLNKCTEKSADSQLRPLVESSTEKQLSLSPPSKRLPITLFGRARHDLDKKLVCKKNKNVVSLETQKELSHHLCPNEKKRSSVEVLNEISNNPQEEGEIEGECKVEVSTSVGKTENGSYSVTLRKLYRSMNVSVPRPLPSLVELMNSNKRARRKYGSN